MGYRERYLYRVRLAVKALRLVPFVRLVGLNGSIVRGDENERSDIDLLIIAKSTRLYTARFFSVIAVHLTGWRRHADKIAGRVCLNCYLNDQDPNILPANSKSERKVANAYKYLIPLIDANMSRKFFKTNAWFAKYKVSGADNSSTLKNVYFNDYPQKPMNSLLEKIFGGWFGDFFEEKIMEFQTRRILRGKKPGDEIVATVKEIRLHPKKSKSL